jgi:hypothetical protein
MKLNKFYEFVQADFEPMTSFHIKKELNTKLWDDFNLDDEIRKDLLQIGQDFFEGTDIHTDVLDIILCGSLCNYNWSERYSDYDLHIIVDQSKIDDNLENAEKLCDFAKRMWNSQHDIKIKGYDVEVAIQDVENLDMAMNTGRMGGVFSLMFNKWIKKPEKIDFKPDEKTIRKKAEPVMEKIDELKEKFNDYSYPKFKDEIDKVWDKVKNFRKSGLESEGGEFSVGNLVFKLLRRNGYVNTVMELKRDAYDKQFK